jgi:hypothetical protein
MRKGRQLLAKPVHVHQAYPGREDEPIPKQYEKFIDYHNRTQETKVHDSVFNMLIELGFGEPNQHEYLRRLGEVRNLLYQVENELQALWPKQ